MTEREDSRGAHRHPSARDIFGERVERYAELDVFSEDKYYRPLLEAAAPAKGERVLDIGAGTGLLALLLSEAAGEVTGIDVTPEMLERARSRIEKAGAGNVTFLEAEAARLPFPGERFDLVTSRTAFHHFPDPQRALVEIHRVLRPGGRLVIEDVTGPEDDDIRELRERIEKLFDPSHILAYRLSEMRQMLGQAGFRIRKEIKPETKGLPLDLILGLEKIHEAEKAGEISRILEENLDRDLGGFIAYEREGVLTLRWQTFIISAARE